MIQMLLKRSHYFGREPVPTEFTHRNQSLRPKICHFEEETASPFARQQTRDQASEGVNANSNNCVRRLRQMGSDSESPPGVTQHVYNTAPIVPQVGKRLQPYKSNAIDEFFAVRLAGTNSLFFSAVVVKTRGEDRDAMSALD